MAISRYTTTARLLHWLMAMLILLTVPAGLVMVRSDIDGNLQDALYLYHKNVGVFLLLLVVVRLAVRWRNPPPALPSALSSSLPSSLSRWQSRIASATHRMLYALLIIVPVAGIVRVQAGGYPIEVLDLLRIPFWVPPSDEVAQQAKTVHYWAGLLIIAFMVLHITAALFHGAVRRDGIFSRMWPPVGGQERDVH